MILLKNDGGNGGVGGVEVPMERMRVERKVYQRKQKNEMTERLRVSQPKRREDRVIVRWIVGLGGALARGDKKNLTLTFFLFLIVDCDVTICSNDYHLSYISFDYPYKIIKV